MNGARKHICFLIIFGWPHRHTNVYVSRQRHKQNCGSIVFQRKLMWNHHFMCNVSLVIHVFGEGNVCFFHIFWLYTNALHVIFLSSSLIKSFTKILVHLYPCKNVRLRFMERHACVVKKDLINPHQMVLTNKKHCY